MSAPTRRDLTADILAALSKRGTSEDGDSLPVAYTVHALAREIKANASAVETALRRLQRNGQVIVRHTKANDVLYKLPDQFHPGVVQPGEVSAARRKSPGERPRGGRKVRMTGVY